MFTRFEQGVRKNEDCRADCSGRKYVLMAGNADHLSKTFFKLIGDGIVTAIRIFYKNIVLLDKRGKTWNNGNVFAGVQLKDHESRKVQAKREHFQRNAYYVEFSRVSIGI